MSEPAPTVFVVDDDDAVRDAIGLLLRANGFMARCYASAELFLDQFDPDAAGCLLLDIRMPGMGGMNLQKVLIERACRLPVIFLTGHGDVPLAVEAMKHGALEFLQKPVDESRLLSGIQAALARDVEQRRSAAARHETGERMRRLTAREREVMSMLVDGKATKSIAAELHLSPRTVEIHRSRVMRKMEVRSLAGLVRMVVNAGDG